MTNQEKEVSFVFRMTEASDPMGRLIFDLGSQVGTLSLTSVKIEELEDTITGLSPSDIEVTIVVSPNPTQGDVKLIGLKGFYTLTIQNISGVVINSLDLTGQETYNLSTEGLGTGIYLLKLQSVDKTITRKLIKR
jgi:nitrous oxidase accessory protein NosD